MTSRRLSQFILKYQRVHSGSLLFADQFNVMRSHLNQLLEPHWIQHCGAHRRWHSVSDSSSSIRSSSSSPVSSRSPKSDTRGAQGDSHRRDLHHIEHRCVLRRRTNQLPEAFDSTTLCLSLLSGSLWSPIRCSMLSAILRFIHLLAAKRRFVNANNDVALLVNVNVTVLLCFVTTLVDLEFGFFSCREFCCVTGLVDFDESTTTTAIPPRPSIPSSSCINRSSTGAWLSRATLA